MEQKEQLLPQICTAGTGPKPATLQGSCISAGSPEFCFRSSSCILVAELKFAYFFLGEFALWKVESRQESSVHMLNMVLECSLS